MSTTHITIATTSKGVLEAIQVPTSAPGPNEVLVKIEYAGITPLEVTMVDLGHFVQSYPTRLGVNAAGTIVKVGSDVKSLVVGDKVCFDLLHDTQR